MDINKLISTVILVTAISTIYLFGMIFYLYRNADSATLSLLKDAFSTTSGFLSGIATLTTAYVAAKLFNKWQDQHNKQVNSDFIMKFYDDLFNMKADALLIVGFLKDFSELSFEEKIEHYENLKKNNIRLYTLKDFSIQKLADLAFIINEDEYNNHFKIKIKELGQKLDILLLIYKVFIDIYSLEKRNNLASYHEIQENERAWCEKLPELQSDLYDHYRAFMVELRKYYRA